MEPIEIDDKSKFRHDSARSNKSSSSADLIIERGLGAMRTPPHIKISAVKWPASRDNSLPETLDLRSKLQPVRDQGIYPTCVAFAASCVKEYQEFEDFGLRENMSPQFIYNARVNYPNDGMWGSDAVAILQTYGCPLERDFPYAAQRSNYSDIPATVKEKAKNFVVEKYAYINNTLAMKSALATNGVCIISLPVFNYDLWFWRQATPDDVGIGGHCVAVVGYTKDSFILRNSWGIGWGDKGYTYMPFSEFGAAWEAWTAVDSPSSPVKPESCCCLF